MFAYILSERMRCFLECDSLWSVLVWVWQLPRAVLKNRDRFLRLFIELL